MEQIIKLETYSISITLILDNITESIGYAEFYKFIRQESYANVSVPKVGVSIPLGELQFRLNPKSSVIDYINQGNKLKVKITYYNNKTSQSISHNYLVTNFDYHYNYPNFVVTLYLMEDLKDFITNIQQRAFKDISFIDMIRQITSIPLDIDKSLLTTDDTQTWLQPNITDYQFITDSIKHSNVKDDLILSAIVNSKLRLKTINAINKTPTIERHYISTLSTTPKEKYKSTKTIPTLSVESSMGAWQYNLSIPYVPTLEILQDKTQDKTASTPQSKYQSIWDFNRIPSCKLDCGNTHKNYWNSQLNNEKTLSNLYRYIVRVEIPNYPIIDINLLDTIDLEVGTDSDTKSTTLSGTYAVVGLARYTSHTDNVTQISLAKGVKTNG